MNMKTITKKEIISEIMYQKRLCLDDEVILEVFKSLNNEYENKDRFVRWGKEHFNAVKKAIIMQSEREEKLKEDYLQTLKVNYDELMDPDIVKGVLAFVGLVISVVLSFIAVSDNSRNVNYVTIQSCILIFLIFVYYAIISIKARYSYKNRFYKQIIDSVMNSESKALHNDDSPLDC